MSHSPGPGRGRKVALLFALYVAQGLPFGFFTLALPVLLRDAGRSLTAISALSLLTLPWALKFLWAPLVDRRGGRKAWLVTLQVSAVLTALVLAPLDIDSNYALLFGAALLFNVIAATQDVVTDGLAVRLLDDRERGLGNGLQVGAYRLGMILGSGLLLWIYARAGWQPMFLSMAALLAVTLLPVLAVGELPTSATSTAPRLRELWLGWWQRALMPGMPAFALLVVAYRFGDQMVSALLGPFLRDAGLALETIALLKGVVGSTTSLAGAVLGGWFVFSVGRRRAVLVCGLAQAAAFGLYIAVAAGAGGEPLLWVATVLEGVVGTMATVALFTLMMDAADRDHAGTDYTLLASLVVGVGVVANVAAGVLADAVGYLPTFVAGTLLAVAGCLVVVARLDRAPPGTRGTRAWARR